MKKIKPSKIIVNKMRGYLSNDVLRENPYLDWESRQDIEDFLVNNQDIIIPYFFKAILEYLDENCLKEDCENKPKEA